MTTAIGYCETCRKDTVHYLGVVDGSWAILGCRECKQASKAKECTSALTGVAKVQKPKKPRNHEETDLDRKPIDIPI